jgi:hypothetical protein
MMIHCKELSDKVVRLLTIYEDAIEAKYIHDQGGEPCILRDYSTPAIPR